MQRRMLLGGFIAGLLPSRLVARANDEERITELLDRLVRAVRAKDFPHVMECYLPDESSLVFDVQGQFAGRAAVRNHWDEVLKSIQGPMHFEVSDVAITTGGTVAYAHCIERVIAVKGENAVDKTVRNTRGLRKVNGEWFIVHEHVSVSVDLATGGPDPAPKA